jgi:hypothetical protein
VVEEHEAPQGLAAAEHRRRAARARRLGGCRRRGRRLPRPIDEELPAGGAPIEVLLEARPALGRRPSLDELRDGLFARATHHTPEPGFNQRGREVVNVGAARDVPLGGDATP